MSAFELWTSHRQHVHALLDQLPPVQLAAVEALLESMVDQLSRKLAQADLDDEPFTEQDREYVAVADEWSNHNAPIPLENVLADFGLTMANWDAMGKTPLTEDNRKPRDRKEAYR